MRILKTFVFILILSLAAAACSQPRTAEPEPEQAQDSDAQRPPFENAQAYRGEGFSFHYPQGWVLLAEERAEGSLTLRFQEQGNPSAQVITSYFPSPGYSQEQALREAEALLRGSLFSIQEHLQTRKERIGDREISVIHTRSGETETKTVQTAAIIGEKGFLLATLIVRQEDEAYFIPIYHSILEGMVVE